MDSQILINPHKQMHHRLKLWKKTSQTQPKDAHTFKEFQLSDSSNWETGLAEGIHRPLMHQPVNYPDVRLYGVRTSTNDMEKDKINK